MPRRSPALPLPLPLNLTPTPTLTQEPNERSYHAFYQLCAGARDDERAALRLLHPDDPAPDRAASAAGATARRFRSLCEGDCVALASVSRLRHNARTLTFTLTFTRARARARARALTLTKIDDAAALAETKAALGGLCAVLRAAPRTAAPRESASLTAWADEGEAAVWACVAACLHLGNVAFAPGPPSGGKAVAVLREPSRASLQAAAALWQVDGPAAYS